MYILGMYYTYSRLSESSVGYVFRHVSKNNWEREGLKNIQAYFCKYKWLCLLFLTQKQNYVSGISKLRHPDLVVHMKYKTCRRHTKKYWFTITNTQFLITFLPLK